MKRNNSKFEGRFRKKSPYALGFINWANLLIGMNIGVDY
jgi:hypothetical protein